MRPPTCKNNKFVKNHHITYFNAKFRRTTKTFRIDCCNKKFPMLIITFYIHGAKHSSWIFLIFLNRGRGQNASSDALTCLYAKLFMTSNFVIKFRNRVKILKQPSNEFNRKSFLSFQNGQNLTAKDDTLPNFDPPKCQNMKIFESH